LKIDPDTLDVSVVGSLGTTVNFGDLAADHSTNTLYMLGGRGNDNLYTVNLTSGHSTLIGSHGVTDLFALAYDSANSTLYGGQFSGSNGFYSIDTSTGAATLIGNMPQGIGGMTYRPDTNQLIGVNDGSGDLYSIDPTNGSQTLLASPGGNDDSDIAFAANRNALYDADYVGNLYQYDANTYARTTIAAGLGSLDGLEYMGSSSAATPEPGSLALLVGMGISGAVFLKRRKRSAR
jgi:DNA-binding beta-propeller fold protein YncE